MFRSLLVCLFAIVTATCAAADERVAEPLSNFPQTTIEIATPDARLHRFKVWIADTHAHREQGLMFVRELPDDGGMLFVFPNTARVGFWMKNTFIPLDMLFIRADGRIDSIAANTPPFSEAVIHSDGEVQKVLEVKGGTAKRLGIKAGAIVNAPQQAAE